MHTGDRSAEAIDAGQVLPGYSGVTVRDGYAGYGHLTDALHAWCGAHLLRHCLPSRLVRASPPDFGEQLREGSALVVASSRGLQTR
jgi:Transposase IS66 family